MSVVVLYNQSILDVALQHTGTVENCFAIAVANGFSVSDILSAGSSIEIPEDIQKNSDVLNEYNAKKITPATGTTIGQDNEIPTFNGIGYMQIGNSFKVSES
jgi:hypothetical protein